MIILNLNSKGPASVEQALLNATKNFIQAQFAASGDGQLPQDVDPFYYDLNDGCFFEAQSLPGEHLTWGILSTTLGWLYKHLGESAQYRSGASFGIRDSGWGAVAIGHITFGYSGKPTPQVVAGPAGVTNYG